MVRWLVAPAFCTASLAAFALALTPLDAQGPAQFSSANEAREALDAARQQQRNARARGERLEKQAAAAREAEEKAVQQAAALAARVQQAEAGIAAAEARFDLASRQRQALDRQLAQRREPLVRLTGALQSMARRPLTLSALQPGSLRDLVHTRAVLDSTIPLVRSRTAALRGELARARALEAEASAALSDRRESERVLGERRKQLIAAAARQRLVAQRASGGANREAQRALVLAEQARDLDGLVDQLESAGSLRTQLAALPGPIIRPEDPAAATVAAIPIPTPSETAPPARYQLPVNGRVTRGFRESGTGGSREAGIELYPRPSAQVVAPAAGRVAFAGPYRGYGKIVIVEHENGWTSLITGLGSLDAEVGQAVTAGSPLGLAGARAPAITLELRRQRTPVNPLDYLQ
ncbi:murein hydrolase activator EnvC family protein [Erythrobacter mangrovi]|uniref:Peptidoglycan DD-metalloendopeptidase family protein n=1 Tax=Erythrobacter mangrovi TaxID=2739433 RepID=A0A7D3XAY3_9SPHN|nr:peptidoglycan DD-metalloendopeptidase family protein [Erythrobacter mangrovi]QKG70940.1 peptidoglycan DD-metalloendopeptidase family protein [Erythrobacter mangrovi]